MSDQHSALREDSDGVPEISPPTDAKRANAGPSGPGGASSSQGIGEVSGLRRKGRPKGSKNRPRNIKMLPATGVRPDTRASRYGLRIGMVRSIVPETDVDKVPEQLMQDVQARDQQACELGDTVSRDTRSMSKVSGGETVVMPEMVAPLILTRDGAEGMKVRVRGQSEGDEGPTHSPIYIDDENSSFDEDELTHEYIDSELGKEISIAGMSFSLSSLERNLQFDSPKGNPLFLLSIPVYESVYNTLLFGVDGVSGEYYALKQGECLVLPDKPAEPFVQVMGDSWEAELEAQVTNDPESTDELSRANQDKGLTGIVIHAPDEEFSSGGTEGDEFNDPHYWDHIGVMGNTSLVNISNTEFDAMMVEGIELPSLIETSQDLTSTGLDERKLSFPHKYLPEMPVLQDSDVITGTSSAEVSSETEVKSGEQYPLDPSENGSEGDLRTCTPQDAARTSILVEYEQESGTTQWDTHSIDTIEMETGIKSLTLRDKCSLSFTSEQAETFQSLNKDDKRVSTEDELKSSEIEDVQPLTKPHVLVDWRLTPDICLSNLHPLQVAKAPPIDARPTCLIRGVKLVYHPDCPHFWLDLDRGYQYTEIAKRSQADESRHFQRIEPGATPIIGPWTPRIPSYALSKGVTLYALPAIQDQYMDDKLIDFFQPEVCGDGEPASVPLKKSPEIELVTKPEGVVPVMDVASEEKCSPNKPLTIKEKRSASGHRYTKRQKKKRETSANTPLESTEDENSSEESVHNTSPNDARKGKEAWLPMTVQNILEFKGSQNPCIDLEKQRDYWRLVCQTRDSLTTSEIKTAMGTAGRRMSNVRLKIPDNWIEASDANGEFQEFFDTLSQTLKDRDRDASPTHHHRTDDSGILACRGENLKVYPDRMPTLEPCFECDLFIPLTGIPTIDLCELSEARNKVLLRFDEYKSFDAVLELNRFQHLYVYEYLYSNTDKGFENRSYEEFWRAITSEIFHRRPLPKPFWQEYAECDMMKLKDILRLTLTMNPQEDLQSLGYWRKIILQVKGYLRKSELCGVLEIERRALRRIIPHLPACWYHDGPAVQDSLEFRKTITAEHERREGDSDLMPRAEDIPVNVKRMGKSAPYMDSPLFIRITGESMYDLEVLAVARARVESNMSEGANLAGLDFMNEFQHEHFQNWLHPSRYLCQLERTSYERLQNVIGIAKEGREKSSFEPDEDNTGFRYVDLDKLMTFHYTQNPQMDLENLRAWWKLVYQIREDLDENQITMALEVIQQCLRNILPHIPPGWYEGSKIPLEHQEFVNQITTELYDRNAGVQTPERNNHTGKRLEAMPKRVLVDFRSLVRSEPCFGNALFIKLTDRPVEMLSDLNCVRELLTEVIEQCTDLEGLECMNEFQHIYLQRVFTGRDIEGYEDPLPLSATSEEKSYQAFREELKSTRYLRNRVIQLREPNAGFSQDMSRDQQEYLVGEEGRNSKEKMRRWKDEFTALPSNLKSEGIGEPPPVPENTPVKPTKQSGGITSEQLEAALHGCKTKLATSILVQPEIPLHPWNPLKPTPTPTSHDTDIDRANYLDQLYGDYSRWLMTESIVDPKELIPLWVERENEDPFQQIEILSAQTNICLLVREKIPTWVLTVLKRRLEERFQVWSQLPIEYQKHGDDKLVDTMAAINDTIVNRGRTGFDINLSENPIRVADLRWDSPLSMYPELFTHAIAATERDEYADLLRLRSQAAIFAKTTWTIEHCLLMNRFYHELLMYRIEVTDSFPEGEQTVLTRSEEGSYEDSAIFLGRLLRERKAIEENVEVESLDMTSESQGVETKLRYATARRAVIIERLQCYDLGQLYMRMAEEKQAHMHIVAGLRCPLAIANEEQTYSRFITQMQNQTMAFDDGSDKPDISFPIINKIELTPRIEGDLRVIPSVGPTIWQDSPSPSRVLGTRQEPPNFCFICGHMRQPGLGHVSHYKSCKYYVTDVGRLPFMEMATPTVVGRAGTIPPGSAINDQENRDRRTPERDLQPVMGVAQLRANTGMLPPASKASITVLRGCKDCHKTVALGVGGLQTRTLEPHLLKDCPIKQRSVQGSLKVQQPKVNYDQVIHSSVDSSCDPELSTGQKVRPVEAKGSEHCRSKGQSCIKPDSFTTDKGRGELQLNIGASTERLRNSQPSVIDSQLTSKQIVTEKEIGQELYKPETVPTQVTASQSRQTGVSRGSHKSESTKPEQSVANLHLVSEEGITEVPKVSSVSDTEDQLVPELVGSFEPDPLVQKMSRRSEDAERFSAMEQAFLAGRGGGAYNVPTGRTHTGTSDARLPRQPSYHHSPGVTFTQPDNRQTAYGHHSLSPIEGTPTGPEGSASQPRTSSGIRGLTHGVGIVDPPEYATDDPYAGRVRTGEPRNPVGTEIVYDQRGVSGDDPGQQPHGYTRSSGGDGDGDGDGDGGDDGGGPGRNDNNGNPNDRPARGPPRGQSLDETLVGTICTMTNLMEQNQQLQRLTMRGQVNHLEAIETLKQTAHTQRQDEKLKELPMFDGTKRSEFVVWYTMIARFCEINNADRRETFTARAGRSVLQTIQGYTLETPWDKVVDAIRKNHSDIPTVRAVYQKLNMMKQGVDEFIHDYIYMWQCVHWFMNKGNPDQVTDTGVITMFMDSITDEHIRKKCHTHHPEPETLGDMFRVAVEKGVMQMEMNSYYKKFDVSTVSALNAEFVKNAKCYSCQQIGHLRGQPACPNAERDAAAPRSPRPFKKFVPKEGSTPAEGLTMGTASFNYSQSAIVPKETLEEMLEKYRELAKREAQAKARATHHKSKFERSDSKVKVLDAKTKELETKVKTLKNTVKNKATSDKKAKSQSPAKAIIKDKTHAKATTKVAVKAVKTKDSTPKPAAEVACLSDESEVSVEESDLEDMTCFMVQGDESGVSSVEDTESESESE